MHKRKLVLEDGTTFSGTAFGSDTVRSGDIIFYTGMTGYQEAITNPNYYKKIIVMTYPSIGNYGINRDDFEAIEPFISGMVVKELCDVPSNFRSEETMDAFLKRHDIPGISGIDTRMLTRKIREQGAMRAVFVDESEAEPTKHFHTLDLTAMAKDVSIAKPYIVPGSGKRITIIDFGMKQSILRELMARNCHITVVPYHYSLEQIASFYPDGVLLSNGPGNPVEMDARIDLVKDLIGKYPMFGIGLGHQFIGLAYGAATRKHLSGQYGVQFPIRSIAEEQISFTAKSHDYYIDEASLTHTDLEVTHRSLNDGYIEGLKQDDDAVLSVQFHPEGIPGSNEMSGIFDLFIENIANKQLKNGGTRHA